MPIDTTAQIIGAFAATGYILAVQQKNRLRNIVILTLAGLLDLFQYYFVCNYASVFTLIGGQIYSIIIITCILRKAITPKWVIATYLSYLLASGILAWGGIIPFIAMLTNVLFALFLGWGKMQYIRIATLICALAWLANGL